MLIDRTQLGMTVRQYAQDTQDSIRYLRDQFYTRAGEALITTRNGLEGREDVQDAIEALERAANTAHRLAGELYRLGTLRDVMEDGLGEVSA